MPVVGILNGTVATDYGVFPAHVLIRDGRIAALLDDARDLPSLGVRIDARGLVILPGGLDPHCHFREPGPIAREGWRHGTMAAAAGGVTTALEYPQADPPVHDLETFPLKHGLANAGAVIDFALWGGAIPSSVRGGTFPEMHAAGVVGFKGFMHSNMLNFPAIDAHDWPPPTPPDISRLPKGCLFQLRCPYVTERCREIEPMPLEVGVDHDAKCHLATSSYAAAH